MTTLQVLSDLHLEFLSERGRMDFIRNLDPEGVDVLVLAGDIGLVQDPKRNGGLAELLHAFCQRFPQVVYVLGNHEYYGSSPEAVHGEMWDICIANPNLTWLDNNSAEVAGLKFIGGTLWFPRQPSETEIIGKLGLNDFRLIKDFEPWVYEQNHLCQEFLKAQMATADVVVTHHMPSAAFTAPRFRTETHMNRFFYTELIRDIEEHEPPLWVFGHTHDRMWTYVRNTVAVCNPLGYPQEPGEEVRGRYVRKLLLEVGPTRVRSYDDVLQGKSHRYVGFKGPSPGR